MNDCAHKMAFEIRAAIKKHDLRTVKKLASKCPALLQHVTPHEWPVIHECMSCSCVDLQLLELFVTTGGDVNWRTESGVSLAYLAAMLHERDELTAFLRASGAHMSLYEQGIILMSETSRDDQRKCLSKFRALCNENPNLVHEVGDRGVTLLYYAVDQLKFEFVPVLLDCGSNPNTITHGGESPLGRCSGMKDEEGDACRDILMRFGAVQSDHEKITNLMRHGKSLEAIDALNKAPQLLNRLTYPGAHGLHYAAQYCPDSTLVEYFLEHKVNPNVPDQYFETPLHCASYRGCPKEPDVVEEIIKVLLKHGADMNAVSSEGNTPLHAFVRRPWVSRVVFLAELGAELNHVNQDGQTALDIVYERRFPGYARLAAWLKARGAVRGGSKISQKLHCNK